jgi:hypothetical protein
MADDMRLPSPGYLRARAEALRGVLNEATDECHVGQLKAAIDDLETRATEIEDRVEGGRDIDL